MGFWFYNPDERPVEVEEGKLPPMESQVVFFILVGGALLAAVIGLASVLFNSGDVPVNPPPIG